MTPHPHRSAPQRRAAAPWFTSSYSGGTGNNCLEVADLAPHPAGGVGIRDSKDPEGPALRVGHPAWKAFVAGL
ncbi:toxin [Streptomyces longispororuber]|uniref:Toxin n=1 Tax=Streptomyces longispororuber TaxID=68230 RepID=A0A918ZS18_9ACTN|nr:DUF397 domain-containing protein [Streptomyces longispororuber]GHE65475.1 toxin [Streptomyces longispororuber]